MLADGRFGPKRLAASAFEDDNHQRVTVDSNFVGGVVADLARRPVDPGDDATARLHFIMGERSLVSGRRRPVESPDAARDAARDGTRIASPFALLETLIGCVIDTIAARGEQLTDALDTIEDRILDESVRGDRRRLTGLFGINTKGLPLAENEYGSWIVIALALVSAALAYGVIRVLGIRAPRE